jgi:hypothetical protein
MYKTFFLIFIVLMLGGCMGMMMHGTDHDHNSGETTEQKNTQVSREITGTSSIRRGPLLLKHKNPITRKVQKRKVFSAWAARVW